MKREDGFAGFEPPVFLLWLAIWAIAGWRLGAEAGWSKAGLAGGLLAGLVPSAALSLRAHYGGAGAVIGWSGALCFIVTFFLPRERLGLVAAVFCGFNILSLALLFGFDALAAPSRRSSPSAEEKEEAAAPPDEKTPNLLSDSEE